MLADGIARPQQTPADFGLRSSKGTLHSTGVMKVLVRLSHKRQQILMYGLPWLIKVDTPNADLVALVGISYR